MHSCIAFDWFVSTVGSVLHRSEVYWRRWRCEKVLPRTTLVVVRRSFSSKIVGGGSVAGGWEGTNHASTMLCIAMEASRESLGLIIGFGNEDAASKL